MYQNSENLKYWAPFKITIYRKKSVLDFSVLYSEKSGLSKKLKVSTMVTWIKQSGSKVSHSKVPSSGSHKLTSIIPFL